MHQGLWFGVWRAARATRAGNRLALPFGARALDPESEIQRATEETRERREEGGERSECTRTRDAERADRDRESADRAGK